MAQKIDRKRLEILRILRDAGEPLPGRVITARMRDMGYDISDRTVRFHLLALDRDGLTETNGRQGRRITRYGTSELSRSRVFEKVGFLTSKIDRMTYRMKFDLAHRTGTVVVNLSLLQLNRLREACPMMLRVFEAGYSMGRLITLFAPGEQIEEYIIPEGYVGIGTVCSITVNGVMLAHGIPTATRFGGIIEIENRKPTRFTAIINYNGTSLDPLEIFVKSKMTDYLGATSTGSGQIGASFREFPSESRDRVVELAAELDDAGLGAFMEIGWPGQALREIPINEGHFGAIVIGGLNPVAILEESGFEVESHALSGLVDFGRLFPYHDLESRAASIT